MKTVLVVDDLKAQLNLISGYLEQEGFKVVTAENGNDALEKATAQTPDLVITDLVMPEMSGLEFCRKLKKNPETAEIPVIACTTKDRDMDKKWAKKQGVVAYLVKPFTREEIITAVKRSVG
ncbi:response regulator [Waterburya agarophytonicola K14]|uniref:Response regulator n=1 Tax=Waterburya agarophytonicola KI4 TaxID=2874699 RepID=A0A964BRQ7_9CYAN|nr:response regulator [Waterburya agarophytonicola]MCC0177547.1 response regulator [Waterburya agarophytonicola KI4]